MAAIYYIQILLSKAADNFLLNFFYIFKLIFLMSSYLFKIVEIQNILYILKYILKFYK